MIRARELRGIWLRSREYGRGVELIANAPDPRTHEAHECAAIRGSAISVIDALSCRVSFCLRLRGARIPQNKTPPQTIMEGREHGTWPSSATLQTRKRQQEAADNNGTKRNEDELS